MAVCDCCCIMLTALKDVITAVILSTRLSVGYFGLGCHDLSHNNNKDVNTPLTVSVVLDTESFMCFSTFSFEKL